MLQFDELFYANYYVKITREIDLVLPYFAYEFCNLTNFSYCNFTFCLASGGCSLRSQKGQKEKKSGFKKVRISVDIIPNFLFSIE